MKIARITAFVILTILILTLFSGCRLVPTEEQWYLSSCKMNMVFMGGVEREFGFAQANEIYPFARADFSSISISFTTDGGVSFVSWNGEKMSGTFTYEHTGNYTKVYMTFDNGVSITGDCMEMLNGEKYLVFSYKDIYYTFTPIQRLASLTLDEIVAMVRNGETETLHEVEVTKGEDMFVAKFSEMISYNIASDTATYAIALHADGSYTVLDELREGKALSSYNESKNYIVLYYIEE